MNNVLIFGGLSIFYVVPGLLDYWYVSVPVFLFALVYQKENIRHFAFLYFIALGPYIYNLLSKLLWNQSWGIYFFALQFLVLAIGITVPAINFKRRQHKELSVFLVVFSILYWNLKGAYCMVATFVYLMYITLNHIKHINDEKKRLGDELDSIRDEYTGFLRHEISNGLVPVHGYAQIINRNLEKNDIGKIRKAAASLESSLDRLANLVIYMGKIFSIRGTNYEMKKETISLKEMVALVVDQSQSYAESNNTKLVTEFKNDALVNLDKELAPGIFFNLIKNAIEHSKKQEIHIEVDKINGHGVFSVNNKSFVPPLTAQKIFEAYNTTRQEGTGLGTNYASIVTKAHDGEIDISSNENSGTTVTVKFKTAQSQD